MSMSYLKSRLMTRSIRKPAAVRPFTRLGIEYLEERLAPAGLPAELLVGRTQSAYSINDLSNNTLNITYTVYNQRPEDLSGVLLKTSLQEGVSFSTATKLPDQSGQDLAWSLGTIRGYDRASVTVTVTFPILPPTTVDTGAAAFATLNAGMVTNNTPAVTLTTTPLPAAELRSTPDANTTDPFVQEQAARLRYDPNAIFNYLNNEVGYESYVGSLRGARGTLWSAAGNSLDEASLGVALYRASGIPARYAKGTLSDPLSKQLILSMFPASYQTVGYIPAGTTLADPANDPQLLSETRDHYWLQVNTGSGFQNADTSGLGQTAIGAAYTTATSTFSEVADSLREKTRILLNAEMYSQIGAAFGLASSNGLTDTVVLDRTFNTVDLVGKTLSIGHTVSYTATSAGFLTTKTTTYTPFLDIADEALGDLEQPEAILGSAYQDVKTTFPFLTQIVTGVFLELTQSGPNGVPVTFQRTLADRIGFATRQGLGSPNVSVDPDSPPIVGPFDVWSLSALTGGLDPIVAVKSQARMLSVYQKVVDNAALPDNGTFLSTTQVGIGQTRAYLNALLATSGNLSQELAARSLVAAYFVRPRFTMVSQTVAPRVDQGALVKFEADLISNTMRIVVSPLQSIGAGPAYNTSRGFLEDSIESNLFPSPVIDGLVVQQPTNTSAVFEAASAQQIPLITLEPSDIARLDGLNISLEAKARITLTLRSGLTVIVPQQAVQINSQPAVAWLQLNRSSGEVVGVAENGSHQGTLELVGVIAGVVGSILGLAALGFSWSAYQQALNGQQSGAGETQALKDFRAFTSRFDNVLRGPFGDGTPKPRKPTPARNSAIEQIRQSIEQAEREKINSEKVPGAFTNGYIDRLNALYAALREANGYESDPPLPDIIMDLTGGLFSRNFAETTKVVSSTLTGNLLSVSTTPVSVSANQNTPVTVPVQISTSFADTYDLSAEAPTGWTVSFNTANSLTITPAPGLQGGAFDVRIVAKSKVNPALVAQTILTVNVTATSPGLTLSVPHDPLFTVPYQGAQVPTSFRTTIRNLGPAADTYTVSTANIPSGFSLQTTANSVTVPAGLTGILGLYLVPNGGPLPAPGTVLTFNVTATSTSDPLLTQTQQVTFTMPEVHGLTFVSSPSSVSTTPGAATSTTLTVKAVGNVSETVTLTASPVAGLTTTGLPQPFTLAVGASQSFTIGLTPATTVPLNSTLSPSFSTSFGTTATPFTQLLVVPIRVVVPGADAMAQGAVTASQLGYGDLANRLNDLATATTNLFQNQTDPVARSQSIAAINAIITQVQANQYQAFLVPQLTANRDALAAANSSNAIGNAISALGSTLTTLSTTLQDEFDHRFEFSLSPNTAVAFPGSPTAYLIGIRNTGAQPTTYNFSVNGLPSGVTGSFTQNSVTLQPGESIVGGPNAIHFNVTQTGLSLLPARFPITVTASTAPSITQSENAVLTIRQQLVKVTSVTPSVSFINPGTSVSVSAAVLNAVNTPQTAKVTFTVKNPGGTVVFTSIPVDVTLGITSSLTTVNLGSFSTTGFTLGEYTIDVTVTDASNVPFANSAGQGKLLVGTPLSGTITTTNATLIPQTGNVTTTVSLAAQTALNAPFTLVGQTATTVLSTTITIVGTTAYVAGTNGVDIVDVSNPAAPVRLSTFASGLIVQNGFTIVRQLSGDRILIGSRQTLNATGFRVLIYSIVNPLNPSLISDNFINRAFLNDFLLSGSIALVPTYGAWFFGSSSSGSYVDQFGDVVALNVDSVGGPTVTDLLQGTRNAPENGEFQRYGGTIVNSTTAYIATSTQTGNQFTTATGKLEVINYSDPTNLVHTREVLIPGTFLLSNIAVEGNIAVAIGSTGGLQQNWNDLDGTTANDSGTTGNLTITTLDISDPLNPVVLTTLVTSATFPRGSGFEVQKLAITSVGGGRFAVSLGIVNGSPVIFLVDASTPTTPITSAFQVPSLVNEMSFLNGRLYTTSSTGLLIYDVGEVDAIPATVSVQVPKNTGVNIVPNSYSIAPNQIIPGTTFDTLVWNRQLAFGLNNDTLTWQSQVTNLVSGEVRPVTLGTTVAYNYAESNAIANFPATSVAASRVIAMSPTSRSVTPGNTASYTITLTNPSNAGINFTLLVAGLPAEWVNLPNAFFVSANSTETLTLELTPPALANLKDYGFTVAASTGNGVAGVVEGLLTVNGPAPAVDVQSHGVVVTITPVQSTAGDGSPAYYTVRFTNTGSMTETFDFTESDSAGLIDAFSTFEITVPPGASNFREIRLSLLPQSITPRGVVPFSVTATSQTSSATGTANSTVNVVSSGVSIFFNRTQGKPGETFQAEVTNRGTTTDTFQLSPGDVGGVIASLSTSSVTLEPGQKVMVDVTTTSAPFAAQGFIPLSIVARSTVNANVAAQDSTTLVIDPSIGLTSNFSPASRDITWPGQTEFALLVNNTGNTEDQYSATITGVTGPVTASLIGLDGQPTQTISSFRLPGLSTGSLVLRVNLNGSDFGTVTVQIRSLRNDLSTTSTATVNVLNPVPPILPPVVTPVPPVVSPVPPVVSPPIPSRVQRYFAIGAGQGMEPIVKVYDGITRELKFQFLAYESTFTGGVTVAIGDVNGDGIPDILTGTGEGGGGRVRVFNGIDQTQLANFFAYASEFRGGVNVALGDLDGDGISEVITGAGVGGGGHVRSFKIRNGEAEQLAGPLGNFMAYAADFRGGVHVASADIDGDGKMEIVTGAGSGGASHVRVWRADGVDILNFFAYSLAFSGGVNVAAGDLDGDGKAEIVTGSGGEPGSGPHVEVFQNGEITQSYFAYAPYQDPANIWSGGVRVNVSLGSDGKPGIVTAAAAGVGGGPHIRRWNAATLAEVDNFFAFDPSFEGGVYVG